MTEPQKRRGRPRKIVRRGDPIVEGMSKRDICKALGMSRRLLAQAEWLAAIPKGEFEALVDRPEMPPSISTLANLARRRAKKPTEYVRRCPHCGEILRIEDAL